MESLPGKVLFQPHLPDETGVGQEKGGLGRREWGEHSKGEQQTPPAKESGTSERRREAQEDWSRAREWVMGNEDGKSVCVRLCFFKNQERVKNTKFYTNFHSLFSQLSYANDGVSVLQCLGARGGVSGAGREMGCLDASQ